MKVQVIQQDNLNRNKQPQAFKGIGDGVLRYLATNQAIGANLVDVCFMVTPRTASDMIRRGPDAGAETLRRESMGTVNHTFFGLYGAVVGTLLAYGLNKKFNVSAHEIFVAPETLDILAHNKTEQLKNNKTQLDYLKETLSHLKAYNPTAEHCDKEGYVKLSEKTVDEVAGKFNQLLNDKVKHKDWLNSKTTNSRDVLANLIMQSTGAESKYIIETADGAIKHETNLKSLLSGIFKLSESFNSETVQQAFKEQIDNNKTIADNKYLKSMKKYMKSKSYIGFAIATAVGMSIQPINMYLTKLKTGSDGFVGVEGRSKDNSKGFLGLKVATAGTFFAMVLKTLGLKLSNLKELPKNFMSKMAFKGFWPTISQLKGVYGLTIVSRLLAARDKDELRESATKDFIGFLSWLVLGDIVNKITANALEKDSTKVLNTKEAKQNSVWNNIKRAFNGSLKTRDEIIVETLAKNNISTVKQNGNETIAKTFKEMYKDLDKLPEEIKKATKKRLGILNKAQLAGYLFSGLVLGLGIPNLNIYITNTLDKKRKEKAAKLEQQQTVKA